MTGELRRKNILDQLSLASNPLSATCLAETFSVSRQVIVQDIALLRAADYPIASTNRGYLLEKKKSSKRIFKVRHTDTETRDELQTIVDCGGCVLDVFVNHRAYGIVSAPLMIQSRLEVDNFMKNMESGKSALLKNLTSNYHFHTVEAPSQEVLDIIGRKLEEQGFLAPILDYEKHLMQ